MSYESWKVDDLSEVHNALRERSADFEFRRHPLSASMDEPGYPLDYVVTGRWQIILMKKKRVYSIIRGFVSFGDYEVLDITDDFRGDPMRFGTCDELMRYLYKR